MNNYILKPQKEKKKRSYHHHHHPTIPTENLVFIIILVFFVTIEHTDTFFLFCQNRPPTQKERITMQIFDRSLPLPFTRMFQMRSAQVHVQEDYRFLSEILRIFEISPQSNP